MQRIEFKLEFHPMQKTIKWIYGVKTRKLNAAKDKLPKELQKSWIIDILRAWWIKEQEANQWSLLKIRQSRTSALETIRVQWKTNSLNFQLKPEMLLYGRQQRKLWSTKAKT
ncbi:MAG: hypothetical protein Ta2E_11740 [Mycoplasmoidaceae bacterium]|nr:MAG: hypothetical protein Ta2E_11740 [Mycoplasmoidaceae bacterium]